MDFRSALSYLGTVLEVMGILTLVPAVISWSLGEQYFPVYFITAITSIGYGFILDRSFEKDELTLGSAMVVAGLSFVFASIIGAIPFIPFLSPLDAIFESVSGFTTTGLSVVDVTAMPVTLLFWRSFTQWIGGVGVLIIFLLLSRSIGISSHRLYEAEGRKKIEASVRHTVRRVFMIYGFYTVIGVLLLYMVGMPLFDSVLNTFSSISTGGFTPTAGSIGEYNNIGIEIVAIFLMIIGATSFFMHDKILKRKIKVYLKNPEVRLFWVLIAVFSVLLSLTFLSTMPNGFWLRGGIFHTVSAITTTGFTLTSSLPTASLFLVIMLMFIGGCAGSTSGGIKVFRASVIGKSISWVAKKISIPPEAIAPFKFGGKIIKEYELSIIYLFVCIYILVLGISTLALVLMGSPVVGALFEVTSAQGNVGFSVLSLANIHWFSKVVLIIDMLIGRLEIFPFLALFYMLYKAKFGE